VKARAASKRTSALVGASDPVKRFVSSRSGGFCAFKGCTTALVTGEDLSASILGQIAHIAGEKPGSARYDPTMTDAERNSEANLMAMCPNHHSEIDDHPDEYPVALLKQWKRQHEEVVRRTVGKEMAQLTFSELALVADAFAQPSANVQRSFDLTKLNDKIEKNQLRDVEPEIQMGLSKAAVVHDFIAKAIKTDPNFSDKLKNGFKAKYHQLKYEGSEPKDIFLDLVDLARRHANGRFAPALAIVTTLFEACDIFDR
jgi:hypothetical protein